MGEVAHGHPFSGECWEVVRCCRDDDSDFTPAADQTLKVQQSLSTGQIEEHMLVVEDQERVGRRELGREGLGNWVREVEAQLVK